MATRSHIGKLLPNGKVKYIYCHWDGYLDHNGRILVDHYNTSEKVDELLELGNLSVLAPEIGEKQDFENKQRNQNYCLAYGRDRDEKDQGPKTCNLNDYKPEFVDYVYLYNEQGWNWKKSEEGEFKTVLPYLEKSYNK
jgi:hypothetical protein